MTANKLQEVGGHFESLGTMQSTSFDLAMQATDQWDKIGQAGFSMEGFQSQLTGLQEEANAKREQIKEMKTGKDTGKGKELQQKLLDELKVLDKTTEGLVSKGKEMER